MSAVLELPVRRYTRAAVQGKPGVTDSTTSLLEDAKALQPLQARLEKVLKRVNDELFNAHGEAWGMALQFYSLLRSRAQRDGEVARNIEPLKTMFAYRHPVVKEKKPTKAQTRAKAQLKSALEVATRHDVAGAAGETGGTPPSGAGPRSGA